MQYKCVNCGNISLRWEGRCSSCGEWGTLEEFAEVSRSKSKNLRANSTANSSPANIVSISKAEVNEAKYRKPIDIGEFDRVIGGGLIDGEVILLSGEPGIGKSTLLLQVCEKLSAKMKVLYVSGEESISQLWSRYKRLQVKRDFDVTSEIDVDSIINSIQNDNYQFVVIDSIQALMTLESASYPGSITQVRICGSKIVEMAKRNNVIVIIVGQINKSGSVAGPKILEHMVDCVLHMEGDSEGNYKLLRSLKNRFGSTREIGVFCMAEEGMIEVSNPSEIFTADSADEPGICIGAIVEGSRVIMIEVQALVIDRGDTQIPLKRIANGMNKQRLEMLCAVLSRKGGVFLSDKDVYVNVSGASNIYSPSLDLAVCSAIKSATINKAISNKTIYVGDVSLTGSIKAFWGLDQIIDNAKRLGYLIVVSPISNKKSSSKLKVSIIKKISEI